MGIAQGLSGQDVELIDITTPDGRKQKLQTSENDLLIVGVPVYMGRVPALITDWLGAVEARNTPVVCVVVYGNRAFENALLELKDILSKRGCVPVAGAAYIGEHSFSSAEIPTAGGRPDATDLTHAELFGRKVNEKLRAVSSIENASNANFPGEIPYGGIMELWDVDFIAVGEACTHCGLCAEKCPAGAVAPEDGRSIDTVKCITCCACIKSCPHGARTMKAGPVMDAALRVNRLNSERKEPQTFF